MWQRINPSSLRIIATGIALLSAHAPGFAQTNATLHLKKGPVLTGEIKYLGPASLTITLKGTNSAMSQNYADIARIEWPEPDLWKEAMAAFERGETTEALELFSKLANEPAAINFHPAPGNFVERTRRMILLCHRRLRDGAAIAKLLRQIDWANLPEDERAVSPLLKVWSLVGVSDWPAAKAAAEEAARSVDGASQDLLELSFLQALCASKLGLTDEAINAYAVCYTLPSSDTGLTADSLRESALLLAAHPDRKDELKALAHLYATTAGHGKLWKDAPTEMTQLLTEDMSKPLAAVVEAKDDTKKAQADSAWVTITKIRFEPPPAGMPPPVPAPNNKVLKFEATGGTHKSMSAPAGWPSAETSVAQFSTANSAGTLTHQLKEDPLLQLTNGKKLRLTMELHLGKFAANPSQANKRVSFLRFGLLDANKAGYGVGISLLAGAKGFSIMADPGGAADLLDSSRVMKLNAEPGKSPGSIPAGTAMPCEITIQPQAEGKVHITARVGTNSATTTVDAAVGQPVISNFSGGYFVLRIGKSKTSVQFDNLTIEVSP